MPPRLAMLGVIGGPLIFLSSIAALFGAYEQDGPAHAVLGARGRLRGFVRDLSHRQGLPALADPGRRPGDPGCRTCGEAITRVP